MIRLSWSDPEPDDASAPVDWRVAAVIIATLFLNITFWMVHGNDFRMSHPISLYAIMVGAAALLIAGMFFFGPAFATQAARRPLFGVMEGSFGSVPTVALRICAGIFLMLWIEGFVRIPLLWFLRFIL
jgi:hypothetical protein